MPKLNKLSWYAFSPADYRADTRHLTREQHLAYREILDEIFLAGQHEDPPSIADDDELLASIAMAASPEEWARTRYVLIDGSRAVLRTHNGRITQGRMSIEIAKALAKSETNRGVALRRWQNRPETAKESTKSESGVGNSGNGNGRDHEAPRMSDKQFRFYAVRVAKWAEERGPLLVGGSPADYARAFEIGIGIPYAEWQHEKALHANA